MDTIQESIGWIAATFNICFYLTPTFNFVKVLKGKVNFEESPGVYVTTCYVNSFIWFIYGDMIFSDQVKISNMISALINLIFMLIYLAFELRKYFIDAILNTLILITGSWAVYRALTIVIDDDRVVGDICIGTTFIIFLSPIQILYKVFKEKIIILFLYSLLLFIYQDVYLGLFMPFLLRIFIWLSHMLLELSYQGWKLPFMSIAKDDIRGLGKMAHLERLILSVGEMTILKRKKLLLKLMKENLLKLLIN